MYMPKGVTFSFGTSLGVLYYFMRACCILLTIITMFILRVKLVLAMRTTMTPSSKV
jgi:hypothetical protein